MKNSPLIPLAFAALAAGAPGIAAAYPYAPCQSVNAVPTYVQTSDVRYRSTVGAGTYITSLPAGSGGSCTAVFVPNEKGQTNIRMLLAAHCLQNGAKSGDAAQIFVYYHDFDGVTKDPNRPGFYVGQQEANGVVDYVGALDSTSAPDIALIEATDPPMESVHYATIDASQPLPVGTGVSQIGHAGYPYDPFNYTHGNVSSVLANNGANNYDVDTGESVPGDSGSGVWRDTDQALVGVLYGSSCSSSSNIVGFWELSAVWKYIQPYLAPSGATFVNGYDYTSSYVTPTQNSGNTPGSAPSGGGALDPLTLAGLLALAMLAGVRRGRSMGA